MNTTHTPGPWKADNVMEEEQKTFDVFAENETVANVLVWADDVDGKRARANARLIAAAPDLLEMLENISEYCTLVKDVPFATLDQILASVKRKADTAIAKAKGE